MNPDKKSAERKWRNLHFIPSGDVQVLLKLRHIYLYWSFFLINFIKKRLQRRCFPVNTAKFLRTAFFIEHLQWLLLAFTTNFQNYYWEELSVIVFTLTYPSKQPREAAIRRCFSRKVLLKMLANFIEKMFWSIFHKKL